MMDLHDVVKHWDEIKASERERHKNVMDQFRHDEERMLKAAQKLGGFIDRAEIAEMLGVSMPRVSVLINSGRFRSCDYGYSLRDVERYRDTRKAGRPRTW